MSESLQNLLAFGFVLAGLQVVAVLPWLAVGIGPSWWRQLTKPSSLASIAAAWIGGGIVMAVSIHQISASEPLETFGRGYASVLHAQLILDLFVFIFGGMLLFWPKGGAVALAAFREGVRQPMFWLLTLAAATTLVFSMIVPYYTFGDEYKMYKQIGFDVAMLTAGLFGVLASSISVYEEIEGRTAITLMSKPVTRRQFLLGKYFGILLATLALTLFVGWCFNWTLYIKPYFDRLEEVSDPMPAQLTAAIYDQNLKGWTNNPEAQSFLKGASAWMAESAANHLGLALGFGQVMVLVAIATAIATKVPMAVNLALVLVVFFLGHLAPELVRVTSESGTAGLNLVGFLAQLFQVLLPSLSYFSNSLVVIRDNPLDVWAFATYVGSVLLYAVMYSGIALLLGLILFEDRDLA